jgi:hypothetical protein
MTIDHEPIFDNLDDNLSWKQNSKPHGIMMWRELHLAFVHDYQTQPAT